MTVSYLSMTYSGCPLPLDGPSQSHWHFSLILDLIVLQRTLSFNSLTEQTTRSLRVFHSKLIARAITFQPTRAWEQRWSKDRRGLSARV